MPNSAHLNALFKQYLINQKLSNISIKNYVSDLNRFVSWIKINSPTTPLHLLQPTHYAQYKQFLLTNHTPPKTINRHLSTLRRFGSFLSSSLQITNPTLALTNLSTTLYQQTISTQFTNYLQSQKLTPETVKNYTSNINHLSIPSANSTRRFPLPLAFATLTLILAFLGYLFLKPEFSNITPQTPLRPTQNNFLTPLLSKFQNLGSKVAGVSTTGGSDVTFGGSLDEDFNLAVKGFMEADQHISTTTTKAPLQVVSSIMVENLNVDLLDGYHASEDAAENQIPAIDVNGQMNLAAATPSITANNPLSISSPSLNLSTTTGSGGSINISPDIGGSTNIFANSSSGNTVLINNPSLNGGTLIKGQVGNSNNFNFLSLNSGASLTPVFTVSSAGSVYFSGTLSDANATNIALSDPSNTTLPTGETSILSALNTAITGGSGSSFWTDGGDYLNPTNNENLRIYDSNGSKYITISHDGTNAKLEASEGEIYLEDNTRVAGNLNVSNELQTNGTKRIDGSGNLTNIGATQLNGVNYTWPAADGTAGYILSTNASGILSWVADGGSGSTQNIWATFTADSGTTTANTTTDTLTITGAGIITTAISADTLTLTATEADTLETVTSRGATTNAQIAFNYNSGSPFTVTNSTVVTNLNADQLDGYHASQLCKADGSDCTIPTAGQWTLNEALGLLYPNNNTVDVLIGGTSTASATFRVNPSNGNITSSGDFTLSGQINANGGLITRAANNLTLSTTTSGNLYLTSAAELYFSDARATNIPLTISDADLTNFPAGDQSIVDALNYLFSGLTGEGPGGLWNLTSKIVHPGNTTHDLAIGGTSTASAKFQVFADTGSVTTDGNLTVAGTSDFQGNLANSLGNLALADDTDITGALSVTGNINTTTGAIQTNSVSRIDNSGNLTNIGTTQFNSQTYTWPADDGEANYVLSTSDGTGTLSWANPSALVSSALYWAQNAGSIFTKNSTLDLFIGGQSTESAKFAFINNNSGTPTASISGNLTLNSAGIISSTNMQTLTLGSSSTGALILDSGSSLITLSDPTTLSSTLTVAGASDFQGNLANSTGNLALADDTDITGALSVTGNINTTTGAIQTNSVSRIDNSGNLTNIGTTQFNSQTYTWPADDGQAGYILSTSDGSGTLAWSDPNYFDYWGSTAGTIYPKNSTLDLLIGGQSTASAKFAVLNVNNGTPTASVSAGTSGATYLTAAGSIQTTANQSLTLGGATTGNISLDENTTITGNLTVQGTGTHAFSGTIDPTSVAGFTLTGNIIGSGSPNITGLGIVSLGTGNLYLENTTIGLSTDTNLLTLADNSLTLAGTLTLPNSSILTGDTTYLRSSRGLAVGADETYYIASTGTANLNALTLAGTLTANGGLITRDSEDLTLSTTTSGDLYLTSAGELYLSDTRATNIPLTLTDADLTPFPSGERALLDALNYLLTLAGGGGDTSGFWRNDANLISPTHTTVYELAVGGISTDSATFHVGLSGDVQAGGAALDVAYSRFGAGTTTHSLAAADDLLVTGLFEVDDAAYFDGAVNLATTLAVVGNADFQGILSDSTGNLTITDDVDLTGALAVTGTATVSSTLGVGGNLTVEGWGNFWEGAISLGSKDGTDFYVDDTGGVYLTGTLSTIAGNLTIDSAGSLIISDATQINNTLTVANGNTTTLNGDVTLGNELADAINLTGILTAADGSLIDLSAILHDDTAVQGLKLPQNTTFSNPVSGEGYLAYDTDNNALFVYSDTLGWFQLADYASANIWTDGGGYLYPTDRESIRAYDAGGTDYIDIAHDGTNANITVANTGYLNIDSNLNITQYASIAASLNIGTGNATAGPGNVDISGEFRIGGDQVISKVGNDIKINSGGTKVIIEPDLQINGGDILNGDGNVRISLSGTIALTSITGFFDVERGATLSAGIDTDRPLTITNENNDIRAYFNNNGTLFMPDSTGSNGGISIGTESPTSKLHVTADYTGYLANFTNTGTSIGQDGLLISTNADGAIGLRIYDDYANDDLFSVSTASISANIPASFNAQGDVSIGNDLIFTNLDASYIKSNSHLYLQAGSPYQAENLYLQSAGSGDVIIGTQSATYFKSDGNVGIGTTSPAQKLQVEGNIWAKESSLIIDRPDTAGGWARGISYYDLDSSSGTELAGLGLYGAGSTPTSIYLAHGDGPWSSTKGIHILTNGNVGIGTTNPTSPLYAYSTQDVNSNTIAYRFNWSSSDTLTANRSQHGIYNTVTYSGDHAGYINSLRGIYNQAILNTADAGSNYGMLNYAVGNHPSGTIAGLVGAYNYAYLGSTGNITNAYGTISYAGDNIGTGGTVTNAYALHAQTIGTNVTNRWAIYAPSASDRSYFAGSVGIGTTSPGSLLEVRSGTSSRIQQGDGTDTWYMMAGDNCITGTAGRCWAYNGVASGNMMMRLGSNGSLVIRSTITQNGAPDVAENIKTVDHSIESGDLVISQNYDPNEPDIYEKAIASKSTQPYDHRMIGVISSDPGILLNSNGIDTGKPQETNERPLTIAGRIPVKVSTVNGPILPGDPLTSSNIPGIAMKATQAGTIVARAMEDYQNPDTKVIGKILAFVDLSYYDPDVHLTDTGSLNLTFDGTDYKLQNTSNNQQIDRIGAFGQAVIANLQTGIITATEIVSSKITTSQLITPLANIDQLNADNITTQSLNISQDATVAGTLYAQKIQSPSLDLIDLKYEILNIKYATASSILASIQAKYAGYDSLLNPTVPLTEPEGQSGDASPSSELQLLSDYSIYTQQTAIVDDLTVNNALLSNSLNSISDELYIQPTGSGRIDLLAGVMTISDTGQVTINGDLTVTGTIAANEVNSLRSTIDNLYANTATISGILTIGLPKDSSSEATSSEVTGTGSSDGGSGFTNLLAIYNDQGDQVASIDASGSATLNKLIIANAAQDNATNSAQASSTASAGSATLDAYQTELTITTPLLTPQSLIYITPTANTNNQVIYVKNKQDQSFTVGVNQAVALPITFNWWLIN